METDRASPRRNWFTVKEAADYLGVSPCSVYGYLKMRKNKPPAFRLAGKPKGVWRFPREEFIQWANGSSK